MVFNPFETFVSGKFGQCLNQCVINILQKWLLIKLKKIALLIFLTENNEYKEFKTVAKILSFFFTFIFKNHRHLTFSLIIDVLEKKKKKRILHVNWCFKSIHEDFQWVQKKNSSHFFIVDICFPTCEKHCECY